MHDEQVRERAGHRHRREIPEVVERHLRVERRVDRVRSDRDPAQRVTVGGAARELGHAQVAARARLVVDDELLAELKAQVRKEIGPVATPDVIHFTDGLPKTRSGKIMRRILRKIAENDFGSLGDTSTLADPSLVDRLIEGRQNR